MKTIEQINDEVDEFKWNYIQWMIEFKGQEFYEDYFNLNWRK